MSKRPNEEQIGPNITKAPRENGVQEDGQPRTAPAKVRKDGRRPQIVYRESEPLPNLMKFYAEGNGEDVEVEVIIPPENLSKDNRKVSHKIHLQKYAHMYQAFRTCRILRQLDDCSLFKKCGVEWFGKVKTRQLWGDLVYTRDSDLVAVLMHLGYISSTIGHTPSSVVDARAIICLTKPPASYPSCHRFLKSRSWSGRMGPPGSETDNSCAYSVERFWFVTRTGCIVDLRPAIDSFPAQQPTVQPQTSERYIQTRTAGGRKGPQDVSIQYNLVNEPWLRYSLAAIADKGLKPSQTTAARMLTNTMYLENENTRYQISRIPPSPEEPKDTYTMAVVKTLLPATLMQRMGVPLPADQVDLLHSGLEWEDLQWGTDGLHVKGTEYCLKRVHFMPMCKPGDVATNTGP